MKVMEKLHFFGTTILKLEMTSYSHNGYDITDSCFGKFLAHTLLLPSFIVVRLQIGERPRSLLTQSGPRHD